MREDVARSLRKSASDFSEIVWQRLGKRVGGGRIIVSEMIALDGSLLSKQDLESGVDAWQLLGNSMGMRGIASRVQWGESYKTFTIRYRLRSGNPTEWQKRLIAITHDRDGLLYPAITVQAYLNGKTLLDAAAVRTPDLYRWAIPRVRDAEKRGICNPPRFMSNDGDGNLFVVVKWSELLQNDPPIELAMVSGDMLFDDGDISPELSP